MSIAVEIEKLVETAAGFGTVPMLLTTDESGRPRASAVSVTWEGALARVRAGHRSVANAAARPLVSLLYPAPPGEQYALLVDGEVADVAPDPVAAQEVPGRRAVKPGGWVTVRATSGILHVVTRPHA